MLLSANVIKKEKLESPTDLKIIKNNKPIKKPNISIPVKDINDNYIQIQILKMEKNQKPLKKANIAPNNKLLFERNKNFVKQRALNRILYNVDKIDKIDKMPENDDISLDELKVDLDALNSISSYIGDDEKILYDKNKKTNTNNVGRNNLSCQRNIYNMNSQVSAPNIMNFQRLNNFGLNQQNLNRIDNFRNNYSNNNPICMNNIYNYRNYLQTMSFLNNMKLFENYNRINHLNQKNYANNNINNLSSLSPISYMNPINNIDMVNNENINIFNQAIKNQNIMNFLNKINHLNKLKEFNLIQKFKEITPNGVKIHKIQCTASFVKNNNINNI